jgi:hypothetical protein
MVVIRSEARQRCHGDPVLEHDVADLDGFKEVGVSHRVV